jgi:hypothetical protein
VSVSARTAITVVRLPCIVPFPNPLEKSETGL